MKLKKRMFSFLAVLAVSGLAILMCTACMSAEEKEKANLMNFVGGTLLFILFLRWSEERKEFRNPFYP